MMKAGMVFDTLTFNKNTCLYFISLGNFLPSRNLKVAYIYSGFGSDSDDLPSTGSYAASGNQPNTPSRDTREELSISSELNKLFKLKHIIVGKHLFNKTLAHFLKSKPRFLASFNEELKDVNRRSSTVRDAQLHGLPKSIPGTMNSNEQGPEMNDQVSNSLAQLANAGTVSHKPSESDNPKANLAYEKHKPHHGIPEQKKQSFTL